MSIVAALRLSAVLSGAILGLAISMACRRHVIEALPVQAPPPQIPAAAPKPAPAVSHPTPYVPAPIVVPVAMPVTPVSAREAMAFIRDHEGYSGAVYEDSTGNTTVGYGFNLDAPGAREMASELGIDLSSGRITRGDARKLFRAKTEEALESAHRLFDDFDTRPHDVQLAIADMIYNLGAGGFRKLYGTFRALKNEDYLAAAGRMRRIAWSRQVGGRAEKLADMVEGAALAMR